LLQKTCNNYTASTYFSPTSKDESKFAILELKPNTHMDVIKIWKSVVPLLRNPMIWDL